MKGPKCVRGPLNILATYSGLASAGNPLGNSTARNAPGCASAPGWSCTDEQPERPKTHATGNTLRIRSANGRIGCTVVRRRITPIQLSQGWPGYFESNQEYFQSTIPMNAPTNPPKLERLFQSSISEMGSFAISLG